MRTAERCPTTGRFFRAELLDDGTMDTVMSCSECGRELRYNYEPSMDELEEIEQCGTKEFNRRRLEWARDMFRQDHGEEEPKDPKEVRL